MKVAINGFGRIGRIALRRLVQLEDVQVVAINDVADVATLAHLFKYDSAHGKYQGKVHVEGDQLVIDQNIIQIYQEKDPTQLPWEKLSVDVALECTGLFRREEEANKHLTAGAKKVIISAPSKGEKPVKTIVLGVNDYILDKEDVIVSNASCTTNCLAPVADVLHRNFTIQRGYMTTVHAYTSDQSLHDRYHTDLRRARAAAMNIIPTTTGAGKALGLVMPELEGKIQAMAMRVPVIDGSNIEIHCITEKNTTVEEINQLMKEASQGTYKGIIEYNEDPIVSVDIIGNSHSSIFDSQLTNVMGGNFIKVVSWYDNEAGYAARLVDLVEKIKSI